MESVQQNAMVANPNQVWFPHVLNVRRPEEVAYSYGAKDVVVVDIVSDAEPMKGEMFSFNHARRNVTVLEILETKPAAGDWSGEFWKGVNPVWYRCLGEEGTAPVKKEDD